MLESFCQNKEHRRIMITVMYTARTEFFISIIDATKVIK